MSSDDEGGKELDLTSPEVVTKYKSAAEIVNNALQVVLVHCKPKATIVDICEKGDAFIKEQTGSMYKNGVMSNASFSPGESKRKMALEDVGDLVLIEELEMSQTQPIEEEDENCSICLENLEEPNNIDI